jgi:hypothetical protein
MTRGFISAMKSGTRVVKLDFEDNLTRSSVTAAISIANSSQRQRLVFARSMISSPRPLMIAFTM